MMWRTFETLSSNHDLHYHVIFLLTLAGPNGYDTSPLGNIRYVPRTFSKERSATKAF